MFTIDYSLDEEKIHTEYRDTPQQAENRARYLSKKHHKGGYDGPCVYVFKSEGARGQKVFFGGAVDRIDDDYAADVEPFKTGHMQ